MNLPYIPFYVGDYLADTSHLSTTEHGAYLLLICHYWINGPLPNDPVFLRRVTRISASTVNRKVMSTVIGFFNLQDGFLHHKRIDKELEKAKKKIKQTREAGRLGGLANAKANASISLKHSDSDLNKDKRLFVEDSEEFRLSSLLFQLIIKRNDKFKTPNFQLWARHVDLMIRLDKRTISEIESIILWVQEDPFWQNNILSTESLRRQFDRLLGLSKPKKRGLVL